MQSVTELLKSAGLALQTLASSKENASTPIPARRAAFEATSNSYFETLQTVDVGLQRQILGMEEADIIAVGKKDAPDDVHQVEGKLGNLDIGWLNSRNGIVDRNLEAELWEKARKFLEERSDGKEKGHGQGEGEGDDEVDMIG